MEASTWKAARALTVCGKIWSTSALKRRPFMSSESEWNGMETKMWSATTNDNNVRVEREGDEDAVGDYKRRQ